MNIKKDLFKIFQDNKDNYTLYVKIIEYIEKVIEETKGMENADFYEIIFKLMNSINNAGWEDRHSQQIQLLFDVSNKITSKYEKYLP